MVSEPYKGKIVSLVEILDYSDRLNLAENYGWNIHKIPPRYFVVDFYDYTHNAFSEEQMASLFLGDEAYAGSKNFLKIADAVRDIFGKEWVVPAHNLRGAEHLLFKSFLEGKKVAVNSPTRTLLTLSRYFKTEINTFEDLGDIENDVHAVYIRVSSDNIENL